MNNKRNRRIAMIVAVLMLTMAFSTTGFAAWMGKTIEAQYRNISIWVNGEYKQAKTEQGYVVEPFIVDGTTYVPLRGIAQLLGYNVTFNPTNYRIDISGNVAGGNAALEYQLMVKDARIKELEALLAEQDDYDLDDMEADLIDEYAKIGDVIIEDIILKGNTDDIKVEIYVDLKYDQDEWDELDDRDIERFLQYIVDDLLKEYSSADITGFIEDEDSDDELVEFSIDRDDDVVLGSGSSSGDIADLEDELNDYYDRVSGENFTIYVTEKSGDELYLELTTTEDDITQEVTKDEIEDYLEEIYDVIMTYSEFDDFYVYGDIVDDLGPIEFNFNSSGSVNIPW